VQIVGRKPGRDPEDQEAYAAVMSKVADALCAAAAALLASPATLQELEADGSSEEYGRRFCSVVAAFADVHWHVVGSVQKQHLLLRQVSWVAGLTSSSLGCCCCCCCRAAAAAAAAGLLLLLLGCCCCRAAAAAAAAAGGLMSVLWWRRHVCA
jgi:hypothetical protein